MFDEIIVKKAAYESTLEIFRRLHSIEIKSRDADGEDIDTDEVTDCETTDDIRSDLESAFSSTQNTTTLTLEELTDDMSSTGDTCTSDADSDVLGTKYIIEHSDSELDERTSDLDVSSDSMSSISSAESDSIGGRRISLIFDENTSSVSPNCYAIHNTEQSLKENVEIEHEDHENSVKLDVQDKDGDLDLKTIILSPDGGVELLQSEEYLRNIETPVLINILNELTSGKHDELLPLSSNSCEEEHVDVVDNEIMTIEESESCNINTIQQIRENVLNNSYTTRTLISPSDDISVQDEAVVVTQEKDYVSQDEKTPQLSLQSCTQPTQLTNLLQNSIEHCDRHTQYQLIQELRDIKENLSNLHKTIKLSTSEEFLYTENEIKMHGSNEENVENDEVENKLLPVVNRIYVASRLDKDQNHTLETHQDFFEKESKGVKDFHEDTFNVEEEDTTIQDEINSKFVTEYINKISIASNPSIIPCVSKEKLEDKINKYEEEYDVNDITQNNEDKIQLTGDNVTSIPSAANVSDSQTSNILFESYQRRSNVRGEEGQTTKETLSLSNENVNMENNTCQDNVKSDNSNIDLKEKLEVLDSICSDDNNNASMYMKNYIFENNNKVSKKIENSSNVENVRRISSSSNLCTVTDGKEKTPVLLNYNKIPNTCEQEHLSVGDYRIIDLKQPLVKEVGTKPRIMKYIELETCDDITASLNKDNVQPESKVENPNEVKDGNECENTSPIELNDYANIYLKEYIFEKDLKNLDEEYKKITQVLDALQVDIEQCITMPTNKNILENVLIDNRKEKASTSSSVENQSTVDDSIAEKEDTFENDINDINEGMKQIVEITDAFQVELNDIICNPLNKTCLKDKLRSLPTEKRYSYRHSRSNNAIDIINNEITEADITAVDTEKRDISKIVQESLSKLNEPVVISILPKDITEKLIDKYMTLEKNDIADDEISEDDNVFLEPNHFNEVSAKEIYNTKKRNIFDKDVKDINNQMRCIPKVPSNEEVVLTKDDISILHQWIINDTVRTKTTRRNENSFSEDHIDNTANDKNITVKKDIFNNDIQSINEELKRLSLRSDTLSIDSTGDIFDNNLIVPFHKHARVSTEHQNLPLDLEEEYAGPNAKKTNDIITRDINMSDIRNISNTELYGSVNASQSCKPTDISTIFDQFQNEIEGKAVETNTRPNYQETSVPSTNARRNEDVSKSSITVVVDDGINDCTEGRESRIKPNTLSRKAIKTGVTKPRPTILEKYKFYQTSSGDDVTSSESDGYLSSPVDSSSDDKDVNNDSSLEDVIEELLTIGGTLNKPFGTPECSRDNESMYVEIPKICIKLKTKTKSGSKLQEAYLPNNISKQRKPNITVELSSSGLLPDEDDINPYLSSVQTKDFQRPKSDVSIEMSSSGSIPDDEDIANYFSFEPFKIKSLGVT